MANNQETHGWLIQSYLVASSYLFSSLGLVFAVPYLTSPFGQRYVWIGHFDGIQKSFWVLNLRGAEGGDSDHFHIYFRLIPSYPIFGFTIKYEWSWGFGRTNERTNWSERSKRKYAESCLTLWAVFHCNFAILLASVSHEICITDRQANRSTDQPPHGRRDHPGRTDTPLTQPKSRLYTQHHDVTRTIQRRNQQTDQPTAQPALWTVKHSRVIK